MLRLPSRQRVLGSALRGAVLLSAVLVTGCGARQANPFSRDRSAPQEIRITVDNQTFNDMRLYALTIRGPQFLGQVGGKASRTFTMAWPRFDEIRVRMDFLADETLETNRVDAAPGDRLELIVPPVARGAYLRRR